MGSSCGWEVIVPRCNRTIDVVIPAPPDVETVTSLLRSVIDPELGADIVSLGMVPSVSVSDEGVVTVGVKLTIGGCPLRAQIKKDVELSLIHISEPTRP